MGNLCILFISTRLVFFAGTIFVKLAEIQVSGIFAVLILIPEPEFCVYQLHTASFNFCNWLFARENKFLTKTTNHMVLDLHWQ